MASRQPPYASSVFLNCPFDDRYLPIRNAILFAVFDCGFVPRCALEVDDGGDLRFDKIQRLVSASKFGIHDISRTELDPKTNLPRFNMPLELGIFLAARRFGDATQREKSCLIMDRAPYRYREFISDISGNDVESHDDDPKTAITRVRDWLRGKSGRRTIPGGAAIAERYDRFVGDLPRMCKQADVAPSELTYTDYVAFVSAWLRG